MPYVYSLQHAGAFATFILSILYLRCGAELIIIRPEKTFTFNSLFEMRIYEVLRI